MGHTETCRDKDLRSMALVHTGQYTFKLSSLLVTYRGGGTKQGSSVVQNEHHNLNWDKGRVPMGCPQQGQHSLS